MSAPLTQQSLEGILVQIQAEMAALRQENTALRDRLQAVETPTHRLVLAAETPPTPDDLAVQRGIQEKYTKEDLAEDEAWIFNRRDEVVEFAADIRGLGSTPVVLPPRGVRRVPAFAALLARQQTVERQRHGERGIELLTSALAVRFGTGNPNPDDAAFGLPLRGARPLYTNVTGHGDAIGVPVMR